MRALSLIVLALPLAAAPCNIPVFRYALERWPAGPYAGYLLHKAPLTTADREGFGRVPSHLNLEITPLDADGDLPLRLRRALAKSPPPGMPWLVIFYPGDDDAVAWQGPPSAALLDRLADSPARRELVKRLLSGTSAVWLLFESGDRAKDDAAAGTAERELKRLEKALRIPEPKPDDPPLRLALPLKVEFALQRVAHDDPEEREFVRSVLSGRAGEFKRPALVPVFGRARALHVLAADEIRAGDLTELAEYISGACSCEVKELNPGVDLLVAADWEVLLELGPEPDDLDRPRVPSGPVTLPPAPPAEPPPAAPEPPSRDWMWGGFAVATLVALLAGAALLKGKPS